MNGYLIIRAGSYLYISFGVQTRWTNNRQVAHVINDLWWATRVADSLGGKVVPA